MPSTSAYSVSLCTVPIGSTAFTNPEKANTNASAKRKRLMVIVLAMSADLFTKINLDKPEHRVIDHVHIVGINALRHDGLSFITFNLLGTIYFH